MQISVEMFIEETGLPSISNAQSRTYEVELQSLLEWSKEKLIIISDQALKEEQAKGFDKSPVVVVDGSTSKQISEVSPLGQIQFISRQFISDILIAAYQALLDLSRVVTGRYKASHYVFLNGQQVATDMNSLEAWVNSSPEVKEDDVVRIVDIQPYARRLELLGVTADRQLARRVDKGRRKGIKTGIIITKPNGAYQLAYRRIQGKFGKNVSVSFNFVSGTQMGLPAYFKKGRDGKFGSKGSGPDRTYLYPSLLFKINKEGGLF